jgi:transposase
VKGAHMPKKTGLRYPEEFKAEAVQLARSSPDMPIRQLAYSALQKDCTSRHHGWMKAYPIDLRTKIVEPVRRGTSKSETARRFRVNRSTINRYLEQLDEGGSLAPKRSPGRPLKLDQNAMRLLEEDLKARPWATHKQRSEFLFAVCGVKVSEPTICRSIKRLSHSRKKEQWE